MNTLDPAAAPRRTSVDVTALVTEYRAGSLPAAGALLESFAAYLKKWLRLLVQGRWDRSDEELRHFLAMLGRVNLDMTAQILVQRLKAYEKEDIEQEVKIALLETARQYDLIAPNYRFVLKERLAELTADPLVFGLHPTTGIDDLVDAGDIHAPDIDEDWVAGKTCGPGFDHLSERQRRILQLHKWLGLPQEQVAVRLQISVRTVKRDLHAALHLLDLHLHS